MTRERHVVREGIGGGVIGAIVVAIWFLVFDSFQGAPLRTPAVLGHALGAVLGGQPVPDPARVSVTLAAVLGYTVLHGLAFLAVGLIAAALVAGAEREPVMLLSLLIFFAAFEVFFLALAIFSFPAVVGALTWWAILVGNFLATAAMLLFFFRSHRALAGTLAGRWTHVAREGLVAGLLGAAVVAVWFLAYDTLRFGRPFRTPALLGTAVFDGLPDPSALSINASVVLGYTVLHLAAFCVFGVIAATVLAAAEREPRFLLALLILFLSFEIVFLGVVSAVDEELVGALVWWNIAVGNLLAASAMVGYFVRGHRTLGTRLLERWGED
jgi:hypothetical protein